ncbi:MAG TPA: primosomal protein N', partial [Elusimicrobiota bacterium]|nr:primosomal protein N' [Elusimicrobiota bacterium]
RKAGWYISDELVNAIRDRLAKKEQSLLFLNRRGYATRLRCRACEWESRCPRCAVSLVLHRDPPADALRCHLCEHSEPPPDRCPQCRGEMIKATGRGTQKVLKDLATLFPAARLLRWDRDAMSRRGSQTRAYESVRAGDVDIVVGTQMVAQGHDFPRLTLVGVLDADSALRLPDFRAAERTFQLITQVAGRAGRADRPGEVIVQTRHPDHYALRSVQSRDPASFVEEELSFRREAGYPPFARLAMLRVRAVRADRAEAAAEALTRTLESPDLPDGAAILGPAPAFHERREDESQWQVLLKATPALFPEILQRLEKFEAPTGVSLSVNVDPEDLD